MFPIKIHRARESLPKRHFRRPAQHGANVTVIRVVIPNVDPLPLRREGTNHIAGVLLHLRKEIGKIFQMDGILPPQVENLTVGFIPRRGEKKSLHGVVHVREIAQLLSAPQIKRVALHE